MKRIVTLALMAALATAASAAEPHQCRRNVDPVKAATLNRACESLSTSEVVTQFHSYASGVAPSTLALSEIDHAALRAALQQAAEHIDRSTLVLLANVRHCRKQTSSPESEEMCLPPLNLLNTGLESYDPGDDSLRALGDRQAAERFTAHPHPTHAPPAYTVLECLAVSTTE